MVFVRLIASFRFFKDDIMWDKMFFTDTCKETTVFNISFYIIVAVLVD
jgi:hypothetical protein